MRRLCFQIITYILITTFLSQDLSWAGESLQKSVQKSTVAPQSIFRYLENEGLTPKEILYVWNRLSVIQNVIETNEDGDLSNLQRAIVQAELQGRIDKSLLNIDGCFLYQEKDGENNIYYLDARIIGPKRELARKRIYFFKKGIALSKEFRDDTGIGSDKERIQIACEVGFWIKSSVRDRIVVDEEAKDVLPKDELTGFGKKRRLLLGIGSAIGLAFFVGLGILDFPVGINARSGGAKTTRAQGIVNWIIRNINMATGLPQSFNGDTRWQGAGFLYDHAVAVMILNLMKHKRNARGIIDYYKERYEISMRKLTRLLDRNNAYGILRVLPDRNNNPLKGIINAMSVTDNSRAGAGREWYVDGGPQYWLGLSSLQTDKDEYLAFAEKIAEFGLRLQDTDGGVRAGPKGQKTNDREIDRFELYHTEHNLDAYALFRMLYQITGKEIYKKGMDGILRWLKKAYKESEGYFYQGIDYGTVNDQFATDVQAWSICAVGPEELDKLFGDGTAGKLIENLEKRSLVRVQFTRHDGQTVNITAFDFSDPSRKDIIDQRGGNIPVVTPEWSAQVALAYYEMAVYSLKKGKKEQAVEYKAKGDALIENIMLMATAQGNMNFLPYASVPDIPTGFGWRTSQAHAALAGSWIVFPVMRYNPFVLGGGDLKRSLDKIIDDKEKHGSLGNGHFNGGALAMFVVTPGINVLTLHYWDIILFLVLFVMAINWIGLFDRVCSLVKKGRENRTKDDRPINPFIEFRPPVPREFGQVIRPEWGVIGAGLPEIEYNHNGAQEDKSEKSTAKIDSTKVFESQNPPPRPVTLVLRQSGERNKWEDTSKLPLLDMSQLYAICYLLELKEVLQRTLKALIYGPPNIPVSAREIRSVIGKLTANVYLANNNLHPEIEFLRQLLDPTSLISNLLTNPDLEFASVLDKMYKHPKSIIKNDNMASRNNVRMELIDSLMKIIRLIDKLRYADYQDFRDGGVLRMAKSFHLTVPNYLKLILTTAPPHIVYEPGMNGRPKRPYRIVGGWIIDGTGRFNITPGFIEVEFVSPFVAELYNDLGGMTQGVIRVPAYGYFAKLLERHGVCSQSNYIGPYAQKPDFANDPKLELEIIFEFDENGFRTALNLLRALAHDYTKAAQMTKDNVVHQAAVDLQKMLKHLDWAAERMFFGWRSLCQSGQKKSEKPTKDIAGKNAKHLEEINPKLKSWLEQNKTETKVVDYYLEDGKWVPHKVEYKDTYTVGIDDKGNLLQEEKYQLTEEEQKRLNQVLESCAYDELGKPVRFRIVLGETSAAWLGDMDHSSLVHVGESTATIWFGEGLFRDLLREDVDELRQKIFLHEKEHLKGNHDVDKEEGYSIFVNEVQKRCQEIQQKLFRSSEEVFKQAGITQEYRLNAARIVDRLKLQPGDKVLDVGPSNMVNIAIAAAIRGATVDVINLNEEENFSDLLGHRHYYLQGARRIRRALGRDLPLPNYYTGKIQEADFEEGSYKAVFLFNVLCDPSIKYYEKEEIFLRAVKLLEEGGHLFVSFWTPQVVPYLAGEDMAGLIRLAEKNGYKLEIIEKNIPTESDENSSQLRSPCIHFIKTKIDKGVLKKADDQGDAALKSRTSFPDSTKLNLDTPLSADMLNKEFFTQFENITDAALVLMTVFIIYHDSPLGLRALARKAAWDRNDTAVMDFIESRIKTYYPGYFLDEIEDFLKSGVFENRFVRQSVDLHRYIKNVNRFFREPSTFNMALLYILNIHKEYENLYRYMYTDGELDPDFKDILHEMAISLDEVDGFRGDLKKEFNHALELVSRTVINPEELKFWISRICDRQCLENDNIAMSMDIIIRYFRERQKADEGNSFDPEEVFQKLLDMAYKIDNLGRGYFVYLPKLLDIATNMDLGDEEKIERTCQYFEKEALAELDDFIARTGYIWGIRYTTGSYDQKNYCKYLLHAVMPGPEDVNRRYLSVGSCDGYFESIIDREIKRRNGSGNVACVELSPSLAAVSESIGIKTYKIDANDMSVIESKSKDTILFTDCMGYLDLKKVLNEAKRILSPGGKVAIADYEKQNGEYLALYRPKAPNDIIASLKEAGFSVQESDVVWVAEVDGLMQVVKKENLDKYPFRRYIIVAGINNGRKIFDGVLQKYTKTEEGDFVRRYTEIVEQEKSSGITEKDIEELRRFQTIMPELLSLRHIKFCKDSAQAVCNLLSGKGFTVSFREIYFVRDACSHAYTVVKLCGVDFILDLTAEQYEEGEALGIVLMPVRAAFECKEKLYFYFISFPHFRIGCVRVNISSAGNNRSDYTVEYEDMKPVRIDYIDEKCLVCAFSDIDPRVRELARKEHALVFHGRKDYSSGFSSGEDEFVYEGQDVLVFDIDGTIHKKDEVWDDPNHIVRARFVALLSLGFTMALISNNDITNINNMITDWIPEKLRKNLIVFSNAGARKFTYDENGDQIEDVDHFNEYTLPREDVEILQNIVDDILRELSERIETDDFRKVYSKYDGAERPNTIIRGKDENGNAAQFVLRALPCRDWKQIEPNIPEEVEDERDWVLKEIKRRLPVHIKDKLQFQYGRPYYIDINKKGVNKKNAMEILIRMLGVSKDKVLYFGDEVYEGGNDFSVLETGVKVVAVNEDQSKVPEGAFKGGIGIEATARQLGRIEEFTVNTRIVSETSNAQRKPTVAEIKEWPWQRIKDAEKELVARFGYKGWNLLLAHALSKEVGGYTVPDFEIIEIDELWKPFYEANKDVIDKIIRINQAEEGFKKALEYVYRYYKTFDERKQRLAEMFDAELVDLKTLFKINSLDELIEKLVKDADGEKALFNLLFEINYSFQLRRKALKGKLNYDLAVAGIERYKDFMKRYSRIYCRPSATDEDTKDNAKAGKYNSEPLSCDDFGSASIFFKMNIKVNLDCFISHDVGLAFILQEVLQGEDLEGGVLFSNLHGDSVLELGFGWTKEVPPRKTNPLKDGTEGSSSMIIRVNKNGINSVLYNNVDSGDNRLNYEVCTANKEKYRITISQDMLGKAIEIAKRIEETLGYPIDVEFGVKDGNIYIVQIRPITVKETKTEPLPKFTAEDVIAEFPVSVNGGEIKGARIVLTDDIIGRDMHNYSIQNSLQKAIGFEQPLIFYFEYRLIPEEMTPFLYGDKLYWIGRSIWKVAHDAINTREKGRDVMMGYFGDMDKLKSRFGDMEKITVNGVDILVSRQAFDIYSNGDRAVLVKSGAVPVVDNSELEQSKDLFIPLKDPDEVTDVPVRLGVHFKRFSDRAIIEDLPINMIELKPDELLKDEKLMYWDSEKGEFVEDEANMRKFIEFVKRKRLVVQVHHPSTFDDKGDNGFNLSIGKDNDHESLIKYFEFLEKIRKKYNLADQLVVTVHPPYEVLKYDFERIVKEYGLEGISDHMQIPPDIKRQIERSFLEGANRFFVKLGNVIIENGWSIKVGVENQAYSSKDNWSVGCSIEDFEILMRDTPESIQLTFDTGHSLLSRGDKDEITFTKFGNFAKKYGKYLVNHHFHENEGWANDPGRTTYKADRHRFPSNDHIPGFLNYHLRRCAVEKVPATLEIAIHAYERKTLARLIQGLRQKIEKHLKVEKNHASSSEEITMALKSMARDCESSGREFVLAIDTDIANLKEYAGDLFKALNAAQGALRKEGIDNVRIFIGDGAILKAQIDGYLKDAGKDGRKFILSAVVKADSLKHKLYEGVRDKMQITVVEDTNLPNKEEDRLSYVPILPIVEMAIKKAMGQFVKDEYENLPNIESIIEEQGMLIIYLLPKSKPIPVNNLREKYEIEAKLLISA